MRFKILISLAVLAGAASAADIPRKSPDFAVQLPDGKLARVSDYPRKVICLTFILST